MDILINRWTDRRTDGQIDGQEERYIDIDRSIAIEIDREISTPIYVYR